MSDKRMIQLNESLNPDAVMIEDGYVKDGFVDIWKSIKNKIMDIPGLSNKEEVNAANKKRYTALVADIKKLVADEGFKKYAKDRRKVDQAIMTLDHFVNNGEWQGAHKNIVWFKKYFAKLPDLKKYRDKK